MDVPDLSITWSHTYTSDDIVAVPGFTASLPSLFSAGVYVQVALTPKGNELRLTVGWYFVWNSWSVKATDFRRTTTNSFPEFLFSQRDHRGKVEPQLVLTNNVIRTQSLQPASILPVMMHTRSLESIGRSVRFTRGAAQRHSSYKAMNQFLNKLPSCKAIASERHWITMPAYEY